MPIKDNPDIEDALDGLYHASVYAEEIGEEELARTIGRCYQEMGATTVDEDTEPISDEELTELVAEDTDMTPEELEREAEEFVIGPLEDGEWEYTESDDVERYR